MTEVNKFDDQSIGQGASKAKFIIGSLLGFFLFLTPIPDGEGAFNIAIGFIIGFVGDLLVVGDVNLSIWLSAAVITVSLLLTILAYTAKPSFIENNEYARQMFRSHPVYFISKIIGVAVVWMVMFNFGPEQVTSEFTGGLMLNVLVAGLFPIFLMFAFAMPFLTEFGAMEFIGILIRRFIRTLFTLPGRASIDLMASWFGSSATAVIISRGQHEKGYYTGREAAAICVNFSVVSVPFSFVVASTIGIQNLFLPWYLIIAATCFVLAVLMPRIWPLRNLPDTYMEGVGKQIQEEVPEGMGTFKYAVKLATERANKTKAKDAAKSGLKVYLDVYMDLFPVIIAWGTIGLIIEAYTPIFSTLAWPFGQYMTLLGVPEAMTFASATVVGFIDMFIPAFLIGGAPLATQFIIGALSIVQIIYMAETGVLIAKSKIPLNVPKLFILFLMRTIIALPIIVFLTNIFMNF
jgi:nucleoside recognition membrane protein YjiH